MSAGIVRGIVLAGLAAALPGRVWADGTEFTLRGHDLLVVGDSRWAGCAQGGYYPIRLRVVNRGVSRNLTFRFSSPHGEPAPTVERTIGAEQNATVEFTLPVPMVGPGSGGQLQVLHQGVALEGMRRTLTLSEADYRSDRPALVVISPTPVDVQPFELAATSLTPMSGSHSRRRRFYSSRTENHAVVPPLMLPDSWLGYSGVDLVAVGLPALTGVPANRQQALFDWVETGGTLLLYDVGGPPAQSPELRRLLPPGRYSPAWSQWQATPTDDRRPITITQIDDSGNAQTIQPAGGGRMAQFHWTDNAELISRRKLLEGHVIAFADDPFPGSPQDWAWLLNMLGGNRFRWTARHGVSARSRSEDFLKFLIPGIRGVPVYAFLVLITGFTILIGPLNYYVLWKRKQLYLLVLTIPAIAIVTSITLLGYSVVAHGFSVKSRVRSLTFVDQTRQQAVATARVSLYAGLAPSSGLQFSPETAFFPIWPEGPGFETGHVDWTERQLLTAGWLRSRTRTQFLTITHRAERGRLEVGAVSGNVLTAANGFEWELERLIVADENSRLFAGGPIPAGGSTELSLAKPGDLEAFQKAMNRHPLALPEGSADARRSEFFDFNDWDDGIRSGVNATYASSLMEEHLGTLSRTDTLPPRTYAAVLKTNPDIETGVAGAAERASLHVLFGVY